MRWFFSLSNPFWFGKKVSRVFAILHLAHRLPYFLRDPSHLALKGQCHEIFDFWFFSWISFPQAPEYTIRVVSYFFENSRKYSQLKVHHVSLTPVASLPPVSLIPVVHLDLQISPRIYEKFWNGPNGILWGWGKTDSWKKPEAKNLVTLSLSALLEYFAFLRGIWPKRSYPHVREC